MNYTQSVAIILMLATPCSARLIRHTNAQWNVETKELEAIEFDWQTAPLDPRLPADEQTGTSGFEIGSYPLDANWNAFGITANGIDGGLASFPSGVGVRYEDQNYSVNFDSAMRSGRGPLSIYAVDDSLTFTPQAAIAAIFREGGGFNGSCPIGCRIGFAIEEDDGTHYGTLDALLPADRSMTQIVQWLYETDPDTPVPAMAFIIPEPSAVLLGILALACLVFWRRP